MLNLVSHTVPKGASELKSEVAMFVFNEVSHDRRVLLEADALQASGWQVTIHGIQKAQSAALAIEDRTSGVRIIRHALGPRPLFSQETPLILRRVLGAVWQLCRLAAALLLRLGVPQGRQLNSANNLWSWATRAASSAQGAVVLHAHDLTGGIPVLITPKSDQRLAVYDSHEVYLESGRWARSFTLLRSLVAATLERPLMRRVAALVTVNPSVEAALGQRYSLPQRRVVIYNCAEPLDAHDESAMLLRTAIGVGAEAVVALYHGGFSPVRGLRQILEAASDHRMTGVHFVFMGYGPMERELREKATSNSRIHVLDAVPPEKLANWISGASVGLMPNLPESLNEYYSTPNKLFESIAAGVPVVSSDFPERKKIIFDAIEGPLGAVCDPSNPIDIARAIHDVTSGGKRQRDEYRQRCLRSAQAQWNWDAQAAKLVALYQSIELS